MEKKVRKREKEKTGKRDKILILFSAFSPELMNQFALQVFVSFAIMTEKGLKATT